MSQYKIIGIAACIGIDDVETSPLEEDRPKECTKEKEVATIFALMSNDSIELRGQLVNLLEAGFDLEKSQCKETWAKKINNIKLKQELIFIFQSPDYNQKVKDNALNLLLEILEKTKGILKWKKDKQLEIEIMDGLKTASLKYRDKLESLQKELGEAETIESNAERNLLDILEQGKNGSITSFVEALLRGEFDFKNNNNKERWENQIGNYKLTLALASIHVAIDKTREVKRKALDWYRHCKK